MTIDQYTFDGIWYRLNSLYQAIEQYKKKFQTTIGTLNIRTVTQFTATLKQNKCSAECKCTTFMFDSCAVIFYCMDVHGYMCSKPVSGALAVALMIL